MIVQSYTDGNERKRALDGRAYKKRKGRSCCLGFLSRDLSPLWNWLLISGTDSPFISVLAKKGAIFSRRVEGQEKNQKTFIMRFWLKE